MAQENTGAQAVAGVQLTLGKLIASDVPLGTGTKPRGEREGPVTALLEGQGGVIAKELTSGVPNHCLVRRCIHFPDSLMVVT